jgi:hypothetical protein
VKKLEPSNIPLLAEEGWPKAGVVRAAKMLNLAELTTIIASRYRARLREKRWLRGIELIRIHSSSARASI